MDNTLLQGYAAAAFLYAGIVLGMCYDVTRILRLVINRRIVTHVTDGLFVLAFAAWAYTAFFLSTKGMIRLYGIVLMCVGAALQQWAFGRPICKRIVKRRKSL